MAIKKYVSAVLATSITVSVAFASFAVDSVPTTIPSTKPSPTPAPVIKAESELDRLTKEFGSEAALLIIAAQNEIKTKQASLVSLRKDIKTAKEAKEVDETALTALLDREKALQADLKGKEDALRIIRENLKLKAEFGAEAAEKIIASRDAISVVCSSLNSLRKDIKTAKEAEEVDETALAALLEKETALQADLKAKEDALRILRENLKLKAEFGAEAAEKIIASRGAISVVRSSLDSLRKDIKTAKESEVVDETALAALLEKEKALQADLTTKVKALDEYMKSLRPTLPTPPTPPTPPTTPTPAATTSAN